MLPDIELLANVSVPDAAPVVIGSNCAWMVRPMVGFSVTGNVAPVNVNPVPVIDAPLMVTGAVPDEVSVTGWLTVVPTGSSPKLTLLALSVNCGVVPVPVRLTMAVLPLDELLEMVIAPLAAPATVGSKLTRSVAVCSGLSVIGNVVPVIENPVPLRVAELTVTAAVPEDVSVSV